MKRSSQFQWAPTDGAIFDDQWRMRWLASRRAAEMIFF